MKNKTLNTNFSEADFEQLFKEYFKPLVNFANKFLKNIDNSKEIVHDVFLILWEKRESIETNKSVKSYIYTAVNNKCLNYIRDSKKFTDSVDLERINTGSLSAENIETLEMQAIITRTLDSLSPKVRNVFVLSRYEDLKYREIADKLDISIKTVESHMSKALRELRINLKEFLTLFIAFLLNL